MNSVLIMLLRIISPTSFSVYRTNVDNLIVYSGSNQNIGKANFTGGEAGLKMETQRFNS